MQYRHWRSQGSIPVVMAKVRRKVCRVGSEAGILQGLKRKKGVKIRHVPERILCEVHREGTQIGRLHESMN